MTAPTAPTTLWDHRAVQSAARYAEDLHADDRRKGNGTPVVAHLWSVAAMVTEHGGSTAQVQAAFLHDTVEDHGGMARLADVQDRFGETVASIVHDLSDSTTDTTLPGVEKAPWVDRKTEAISHYRELRNTNPAALLVLAADKIHNLRSLTSDLTVDRYTWHILSNHNPADHVWYYSEIADACRGQIPCRLQAELDRLVQELRTHAANSSHDLR